LRRIFKRRESDGGIGNRGENLACEYLKRNGLKILEENYRTRWGEIDLIAREGDTLVFVEVKTRTQKRFGSPLEAVTTDKQRRIIRMAQTFLAEKRLGDIASRFDVIGIDLTNGSPRIDWIPNAFGGL
jgi:putative endonuclease